jgi:serine/threonine-protein kinase
VRSPAPLGRYVLKERLAQGGMGEVFRAAALGEHGFEKPVVVKRILPAHAGREDLADLFVAEAKLMTRLAHPNIVEVYDFGRGEHRDYYLVLELVDGVDLGRLLRAFALRGQAFPIPLALHVIAQVLRGLHHAHTRLAAEGVTIVHRDVSPGNVLLSAEGEVKVADFGVALMARAAEGGGAVAGKPGYMAPEQFEGRPVDPRADVFSVGVVLHQLLSGSLPFAGETPEAQQDAARAGRRTALPALRAEVGEAIEAIVAQALCPAAEGRFASARAMAQAIEALGEHGQRLASADDLADAVRAAQRLLPIEARPVMALGGAPEEARELTRTAAAGGAFTLRFPVRADATTRQADDGEVRGEGATLDRYSMPEPRTERIEPPSPAGGFPGHGEAGRAGGNGRGDDLGPPSPAGGSQDAAQPGGSEPSPRTSPPPRLPVNSLSPTRAALTALVALAALGLAALAWRADPSPGAPLSPPSSATVPTALSSVPPSASAAPPDASATASARPVATMAPPVRTGARVPATSVASATPSAPAPPGATPAAPAPPSATPSAPAPPSAAPPATPTPDDCTGKVHFSSDHSWDVSGGPTRTQTPGNVVWRCGTYALTGRDRLDPTQAQSVSVTVRPDRTAEVSFRPR